MSDPSTGTAEDGGAPRWRVRVHDDLSLLEATWRKAEAEGALTPYQRFDWLTALVDSVAPSRGAKTFAVEVSHPAGHSVMLLPFARERHQGVTTLSIIDFGVCDYLAPVLLPKAEFADESAPGLWAAIRAALPKADIITIRNMPGEIEGQPNPLLRLGNVRQMALKRYGLATAPPAADLIQRVTRRSTFRDLANLKRRLARRGTVALVAASTPEEVDSIATAMITQRRERFREIGRPNLMDRPEIERFYREAALKGLAHGPARIFGLSVDGEWVGTGYGLVHGTSFALVAQTMAGGTWRKCSPGILTSAAIMEWAVGQGLTYFDFTIGFLPYKLELGAAEGALFELTESLTMRGAAVLATGRVLRDLKSTLRHYPRAYALLRSAWQLLREPRSP